DVPTALVRLQQGVFSRKQALEAGLTGKMIEARLRSGAWRTVSRGVYTNATADISRAGMLWVAVLSAGCYAVLSHQSAAENLGLGGRPDDDIHVTIPATLKIEAVPGVHIHRSRRAYRLELADCYPPCTSVEETVLDMVDTSDTFDEMCGWVTRSLARKRSTAVKLRTAMSARRRLRWHAVLDDMINATITGDHSVLEHRYDRDVERAHGLPEPELQVPFTKPDGSPGRRDRAYPRYRVVIELDGQVYHPAEDSWTDKERDNAAIAAGHEPLRYGWRHVTQDACGTAIQVGRVLRAGGWAGDPHPCSVRCPVPRS
ncbi:MAG TPA: type IV toxin-antitoxin system AbiEi family antitoxin domain-containing protein, partial [Streptosporangiaceae bacterium]